MALLRDFTDRFWNYVSPQKTQQRRDKPFKVPAKPIRVPPAPRRQVQNVEPRSMSPETRVKNWVTTARTPSEASSVAAHIEKQINGFHLRTPSASNSGAGERFDLPTSPELLARPYTDYGGDTLIEEMMTEMGDEEAFDANEETIVVDEDKFEQKDYDPEAEQRRRDKQGRELQAAGWSEDAIFLFQKLGMRGFEPLMPQDWHYDFPLMPASMFTRDSSRVFITAKHAPNYHAQKALKTLLELGTRVRDAIVQRAEERTAEELIKRGVLAYNKWALRDGRVNHSWNLPIFDIVAGNKDVTTAELQERMLKKLGRLAERWREAFRVRSSVERQDEFDDGGADEGASSVNPPSQEEFAQELPTLYGVIISHTIYGFVSYDILAERPSLRTVAIFDFGQGDYDVWNSLAIAIFVIHCRNNMTALKDDLPEYPSCSSSDPDL